MLQTKQIKENVYAFKAINYNDLSFHGPVITTEEGSCYNAYLIIDEQITLIDTVDEKFSDEFIRRIKKVIGNKKIDNIILNHLEYDHSSSYEYIKTFYPEAKTYCSSKSDKVIAKIFSKNYDYIFVEDLSEISIGKYTLKFILTPFIHWPDNMMTYLIEEKILFSNDAFGSLIAQNKFFDYEYDLHELIKSSKIYYANILTGCNNLVSKKLKEIADIEFDYVCPSHGVIWHKNINDILTSYINWSNCLDVKNKIVIIYDTVWGTTETMAQEMATNLGEKGFEVRIFVASKHNPSMIMTELLDAKAILIGSSNLNNAMVSTVADILERIYGLKLKGKVGMAFGAYGWSGVHLKRINARLEEANIRTIHPDVYTNFNVDDGMVKFIEQVSDQLAEELNKL